MCAVRVADPLFGRFLRIERLMFSISCLSSTRMHSSPPASMITLNYFFSVNIYCARREFPQLQRWRQFCPAENVMVMKAHHRAADLLRKPDVPTWARNYSKSIF